MSSGHHFLKGQIHARYKVKENANIRLIDVCLPQACLYKRVRTVRSLYH